MGFGPVNPGLVGSSESRYLSTLHFYEEFAKNQVGLIYLGGVAVSTEGRSNPGSYVMQDLGTRRITNDIKQAIAPHGSHLAVQLMHCGRQALSKDTGSSLLAASPILGDYHAEAPERASPSEIQRIVRRFAEAAAIAAEAGADVIEVHAAHGYLISGFLSRSSNFRTDQYGGSLQNRFRILREILQSIRDAGVRTVGVRVNARENTPLGVTPKELVDGLGPIRELVDFVSVSAGVYTRTEDWIIPRRALGEAVWRDDCRAIGSDLDLPTMLAGNIQERSTAEDVVDSSDADIVLLVRALLADPELATKWRGNREADVQTCTELYLCKYHSRHATHIYCPHNPIMRRSEMLPKVFAHGSTPSP